MRARLSLKVPEFCVDYEDSKKAVMRKKIQYLVIASILLANSCSGLQASPLTATIPSSVRKSASLKAQWGPGDLLAATSGGIEVFRATATTPYLTFHRKFASAIALDHSNNLYAMSSNEVDEFAVGATKPVRTIRVPSGNLISIALDRHDNLYVADAFYDPATGIDGEILVYGPSGTSPIRTITKGIAIFSSDPGGVAFDQSGYLYVLNGIGCPPGSSGCSPYTASVSVYPPGRIIPVRNFAVFSPTSLALDHQNYLYVANTDNQVEIFAPGGTTPTRVISSAKGPINPIAVDSTDHLYVGVGTSVTVYAANQSRVLRTLRLPKSKAFEQVHVIALDNSQNVYVGVNAFSGLSFVAVFKSHTSRLERQLSIPSGDVVDLAVTPP